MADEPQLAEEDRPLVIDELEEQFERFRLLRKSDETATDGILEGLGATTTVDRDIVLELSATRILGQAAKFEEAHGLAMRSLEVLDRNGARAVTRPARLGPLGPLAATLIQWVCRFIVRQHQAKLVDRIADLYERRVSWAAPGDPMRERLLLAATDVRRVADNYKGNPIGVPSVLLGGAVVSGIGGALRAASRAALDNEWAAAAGVVVVSAVFGGVAWTILRGAAVARRRIQLTTDRPMAALWETMGRAGKPPKDASRNFALYAIIITGVAWLAIPAGIAFVVSRI